MSKKNNNKVFPKFKKEIKAFLNSEEGKISKKSIIKAGLVVGAIGGIVNKASAQNTHHSAITDYYPGTHTSHGSHNSHNSHGSHNSHSQW